MKQLIMAIILLGSVAQGIFAQQIKIDGKVHSAQSKEPMEFANVVLQTADSVFVTGTVTDEKGIFSIPVTHAGDYLLAVSSLGYQTAYMPLNGLNKQMTLEEIVLEEEAVNLDNVTVTASNLTSLSDKKLVFPSERQVKASTNGINLLQQLMLPKLQVNPLFNEIKIAGGGEVQLRINGVKVESQDIIALQPADIIRIEYHDNPGLRYGNAEVVLDYIVRRPETGGSAGFDLTDGMLKPKSWGNNFVNARINHKKSEFAVNYGISHRDFYQMWRDNEEKFTFADGYILERQEKGEPGHGQMYWQNLNTTYSYQQDDRMFSATFRYFMDHTAHMDYQGILYNTANPADYVDMIDNTDDLIHRPALDLYYQQSLKNDQTLVFNAVGTYNYTEVKRLYQESRNGQFLTDVNNTVGGKKYSFIGEAIYEKKLGGNRISGGLKHIQTFADNEYRNGHHYTTEMNQAETFLYGEFKGKAQKLDYTLSAGVYRSNFEQGDQGYDHYTFSPRVILHYTLPGKSFIRLRADVGNSNPSLGEVSAVEQIIDSLQIQRGNPELSPYMRYRTELTYEWQKGLFYTNLWGTYEYQPDVIMDEKFIEGDKIIQTWNNQKDWQRLATRATLRVGPIKDILQFSLNGGVNHYISNGHRYRHEYTNWFGKIEATATYKRFMLMFGIETNWNWFQGETMSGGENIHMLMLNYNHKNLSVGVGMFNPFSDNYKQERENWSKYASYHKVNYINESSQFALAKLTWNFSFGRSFKSGSKRVNNSDDNSGVMSTGK